MQEFLDDALDAYAEREKELEQIQEGLMRDLERFIVLQTVDTRWREHLENMDYMREGIGLRGLAQKDPLVEYRNEGHGMFLDLNRAIREEVVTLLFHAEVTPDDGTNLQQQPQPGAGNGSLSYEHESLAGAEAMLAASGGTSTYAGGGGGGGGSVATPVAQRPKVNSEFEKRRPQRSVPVRLGQEVQEVPRRLTAPEPPLADGVIWLDPISEADHGDLLELVGDEAVVAFTHVPTGATPDFVTGWIARYDRGWLDGSSAGFVARDVAGDGFLGFAAIVHLDLVAQQGEIGYAIAPAARGRGVARRSVDLLTRWAFDELELIRLVLDIDVANPGSEAVATRCGYRREGVRRSAYFKEGRRADVGVWSRLRDDPPVP